MNLFQQLFDQYNEFHVSDLAVNRFSAKEFHKVLLPLTKEFEFTHIGNSVEGQPIHSIKLGNGPIKILLWSQMHGNESTATRAILDILQFMGQPNELKIHQQQLLEKLTICIVPMLNPDGTDRFQRRNALNIDINRDARQFEAPESKVLKAIIEDFKADFAFNLHDQRRFYNITGTNKPSTIAFLSPAYDALQGINNARKNAMQLIALLRGALETIIQGQVGLYNDAFTPRAFGDFCQATGTSTILVESGWQSNDMEKEFVRKLNFCLLISAFSAIANNRQLDFTIENYQSIPMNGECLFDVLLRNVLIPTAEANYKTDIGIHHTEVSIKHSSRYYADGVVTDIGDLTDFYGFNEPACANLIVQPGMVWPEEIGGMADLSHAQATEMLKQGYLFVIMQDVGHAPYIDLPINAVAKDFVADIIPVFEGKANFVLKNAAGEITFVMINGFLWNVEEPLPININGLTLN